MNKIIQKIFKENKKIFLENRSIPPNKHSAINSIINCRTSNLGGHKEVCHDCGCFKISYNSCRNRHCPICQNISKENWIEARKAELINSSYFHVVTVPDSLNTIIYANQRLIYSMMFKCVSETLIQIASDEKYFGAKIGLIALLHTWGQNLSYHPHIHCIVPGGGLSFSELLFRHSKKKFFLPVRVLSSKFKQKFLSNLKNLISGEAFVYPKGLSFSDINTIIQKSYDTPWVVYSKPTFKSPSHVIEYLGRYTHKVAITDARIISCNKNSVTFKYRDYKNNNREKTMTLSCVEFMRRFLLHVLPERFIKIRYYGILSTRTRKTKLLKCQKLTDVKPESIVKRSKKEILISILGRVPFVALTVVQMLYLGVLYHLNF